MNNQLPNKEAKRTAFQFSFTLKLTYDISLPYGLPHYQLVE